jgi:hypothetical protein
MVGDSIRAAARARFNLGSKKRSSSSVLLDCYQQSFADSIVVYAYAKPQLSFKTDAMPLYMDLCTVLLRFA